MPRSNARLKRAIRERMEKTGENYTTARTAILKEREEKVEEKVDD